jgi:hypothetical protein
MVSRSFKLQRMLQTAASGYDKKKRTGATGHALCCVRWAALLLPFQRFQDQQHVVQSVHIW